MAASACTPLGKVISISTALLVVDGVTQNDPISNRPRYYNVNMDAIQEISIQTGGFSARYGNFRSGVDPDPYSSPPSGAARGGLFTHRGRAQQQMTA